MIFRWLRSRRRRAILERPFPAAWATILRRLVKHVEWLSEEEQSRLRDWIAIFVAEKRFEGCRGQEITDEVKVAIAGQAGLVALGFPDEFFAGLRSVLVYPGDYVVPRSTPLAGGGELEWQEARLGETWNARQM
jgi:Mlc titration factor MtfA (ptsG expression regulator)